MDLWDQVVHNYGNVGKGFTEKVANGKFKKKYSKDLNSFKSTVIFLIQDFSLLHLCYRYIVDSKTTRVPRNVYITAKKVTEFFLVSIGQPPAV